MQRLRQLGVVQADVLKKEVTNLLQAGFIFPVENSEWISRGRLRLGRIGEGILQETLFKSGKNPGYRTYPLDAEEYSDSHWDKAAGHLLC